LTFKCIQIHDNALFSASATSDGRFLLRKRVHGGRAAVDAAGPQLPGDRRPVAVQRILLHKHELHPIVMKRFALIEFV
jgi:hypothetical protein